MVVAAEGDGPPNIPAHPMPEVALFAPQSFFRGLQLAWSACDFDVLCSAVPSEAKFRSGNQNYAAYTSFTLSLYGSPPSPPSHSVFSRRVVD